MLDYYRDGYTEETGGETYGECFVLTVNEPVSQFSPVQLTYSVKLTDPSTEPGTYGQYDADGSEGLSGLYTNNQAVLLPVATGGAVGEAELLRCQRYHIPLKRLAGHSLEIPGMQTLTQITVGKETEQRLATTSICWPL